MMITGTRSRSESDEVGGLDAGFFLFWLYFLASCQRNGRMDILLVYIRCVR